MSLTDCLHPKVITTGPGDLIPTKYRFIDKNPSVPGTVKHTVDTAFEYPEYELQVLLN